MTWRSAALTDCDCGMLIKLTDVTIVQSFGRFSAGVVLPVAWLSVTPLALFGLSRRGEWSECFFLNDLRWFLDLFDSLPPGTVPDTSFTPCQSPTSA